MSNKLSLWERTKFRVQAFRRSGSWTVFVGVFWALVAFEALNIGAYVLVQFLA